MKFFEFLLVAIGACGFFLGISGISFIISDSTDFQFMPVFAFVLALISFIMIAAYNKMEGDK